MKARVIIPTFLLIAAVIFLFHPHSVLAAEQAGGYLNYQEPKASEPSWLSTVGYLVSLLVTFGLVIALAFFTSRVVGEKFGRPLATGDNKVLVTLPLGANRAVFVVQIADVMMILGVTDQNITLLQEITDPDQKNKMLNSPVNVPAAQFDTVLQRQLSSLQQMSQKFPGVFGSLRRNTSENTREKR